MYVVTFYSFKGGVGRSMALVNVGVQLAKRGKKVLLVDFDLEAPGLTSYAPCADCAGKEGIVEYVCDYIKNGIAPNALNYCYETERFVEGGRLWVMPSGTSDGSYSAKLNGINWAELYELRDGYLLFEDLRRQWASEVKADYVLIDSRTGHSDVEGICTRQLPDAVCFLFFPNEQNLEGLRRVNSLVERENQISREGRRKIFTHFAVSNVPELDDEDGILRGVLASFKEELGYKELSAQIHHYQSLSLLNQDVFSITRPNSRLTREYTELAQAIVNENLQDRDGALNRLKQMSEELPDAARRSRGTGMNAFTGTIQLILLNFPTDSEIRFQSALAYEEIGELQDALDLLTVETAEGSSKPAVAHATRARLFARKTEIEAAVKSLEMMLRSRGADLSTVLEASGLISVVKPELFETLGKSEAVKSLEPAEQFFVATQCEGDVNQLRAQADILQSLLNNASAEEGVDSPLLRRQMAVALIGLGEFEFAISLFEGEPSTQRSIEDRFNLAMARWGVYGRERVKEDMVDVLQMDKAGNRGDRSPNYLQCLAIASYLVGQNDYGRELLEMSKKELSLRPRREFSAWSYLRVDADTFLKHLGEIERLDTDFELRPVFVERRKIAEEQKRLFQ